VVDYTRIKKVVKTKHEVHTRLLTKSPPDANPWFQDKMTRPPPFYRPIPVTTPSAIRRDIFEERHPKNEIALVGSLGWNGRMRWFGMPSFLTQRRKDAEAQRIFEPGRNVF